jgi:hypothetical protein
MAIHSTSSGWWMIRSPWRLNITTMVKSRAPRVMGEIFGMNTSSYQSRPSWASRIPAQDAGAERDAQVDHDAAEDLPHATSTTALQAEERRQDGDEDQA